MYYIISKGEYEVKVYFYAKCFPPLGEQISIKTGRFIPTLALLTLLSIKSFIWDYVKFQLIKISKWLPSSSIQMLSRDSHAYLTVLKICWFHCCHSNTIFLPNSSKDAGCAPKIFEKNLGMWDLETLLGNPVCENQFYCKSMNCLAGSMWWGVPRHSKK